MTHGLSPCSTRRHLSVVPFKHTLSIELVFSERMSSAHIRLIVDALDAYSKETGIDIAEHPFATELQVIDSSDEVFRLLEAKAKGLKDYRGEKLTDCLRLIVNTLYILSDALGEAVSLASFPPAKMIFFGLYVLLTVTSATTSGYDALVGLFEPLESFLKPVQILSEIPNTASTAGVILKIMVEVLSVLSLATKQVEQGELKSFAEKLFGSGDIGAVLQRLNRLTQDEARMTVVQILEVVHGLVYNMKVAIGDGESSLGVIRPALVTMHETVDAVNKVTRGHRLERNRRWLAPPDPSTNYNIARDTAHEKTAMWFFQRSIFRDWMATGSFMWIHGKPGSGKSVLCSSIIQVVMHLRDAGLALVAYFFFDFRDDTKKYPRGLLSSLVCQLSAQSDPCYQI
ncbi:hypothetical protein EDB89DRAFT_1990510 [Lactarius sanguifluus]|nr:hypothetical protein EDB89DRAFT_1990510 [Lactarius sanguifluus]